MNISWKKDVPKCVCIRYCPIFFGRRKGEREGGREGGREGEKKTRWRKKDCKETDRTAKWLSLNDRTQGHGDLFPLYTFIYFKLFYISQVFKLN